MQTPRDISYTGNPTGGTTAYPAVLPAAHEATENSDNIFYRTIRTVMKKQLIYLLASAGLLAAGWRQGHSELEAALTAVWLHGAAADRCARRRSMTAMLPQDILEDLGPLLCELEA